ncbi:transporter substrate-binding domain-containing protein [Maridesulfovibrio hydrothermalis]|uniref:histidine kinase n=1 Tax=Maridesulfovibrio hydrothermalis AM13 = DSM 14728 TaxID=1121451 RepID=L0RF08_9BACT|nr:transporter substrate-binding domain-containing protein [Maridesulfovibrio hydrothermalis]CCO24785.1 Signal transduction histidine kinase, nitrogen specific, NtrB [Maridesulfovibrio hydrothermalis AM13 = DSM 14728]
MKLYTRFGLLQTNLILCILFLFPAFAVAADHIIVEGDFDYPPYEYLDNGIPSGFNIDIIRAVAEAQGMQISITLRAWSDVVEDLERGKCDMLSGMFSSLERSEYIDFSMPYNVISHTVFVRDDSSITSMEDLSDKEIIVQRGDIMHEYALTTFPDAKIITVTSQGDALKLLSSGLHDAALLGKLQNLFRVEKQGFDNIITVGPDFVFGKYCFAVLKGNSELLSQLNEGLSLIKKSGKYDEIYHQWFGVYERKSLYQEFIRNAALILVPLVFFFVFFVFWIWLLRHKVRKKTHELTAELLERHRTEQELTIVQNYLANVINSMPSILIGVDADCNVTQWNHEAERVMGVKQSDVLGLSLDIVAPHLACEMEHVREALRTGQRQVDPKLRRYDDNRVRYEDVTIYPLVGGGVEGAVIRIDDITDRMNLEQMIMQSEKMMSIGGLAAGMAHEINNPLAVIVGHAQNIQRRISPELSKNEVTAARCGTSIESIQMYMDERGVKRMLDGIIVSGNRAAKIVVNMLSFSRKSDKVLGEHNIIEVLDRTLELASSDYDLKKEYDFKQIEVIREYEPDLPPVCCEGNEIQQVFLNLFRNGAEAMNEKSYAAGGPRFILRVRRSGEMVRIEIEDNGPGMSEEVRNRVFEPFYTTKEVGQGTGLGLSVSYFIITDHHNGSLEVDSMAGQWTRFVIKLPIAGHCGF